MSANLEWFENTMSDCFNEARDSLDNVIGAAMSEAYDIDPYGMDWGNWLYNTINVDGVREDTEFRIKMESSKDPQGLVTLKLTDSEGILFKDVLEVPLNAAQSQSFNDMMVIGQTWDCYNHIVRNPIPDLNENYDPLKLPPLDKTL